MSVGLSAVNRLSTLTRDLSSAVSFSFFFQLKHPLLEYPLAMQKGRIA